MQNEIISKSFLKTVVVEYVEKIKREETIIIGRDVIDKMNHIMAINEARSRIAVESDLAQIVSR